MYIIYAGPWGRPGPCIPKYDTVVILLESHRVCLREHCNSTEKSQYRHKTKLSSLLTNLPESDARTTPKYFNRHDMTFNCKWAPVSHNIYVGEMKDRMRSPRCSLRLDLRVVSLRQSKPLLKRFNAEL